MGLQLQASFASFVFYATSGRDDVVPFQNINATFL